MNRTKLLVSCLVIIFFIFPIQARANMFLEMVGLTCEKAVRTVHYVSEVDDILECLKLQQNLIQEKWSELKAEGKVISTPELRKKLDILYKKT